MEIHWRILGRSRIQVHLFLKDNMVLAWATLVGTETRSQENIYESVLAFHMICSDRDKEERTKFSSIDLTCLTPTQNSTMWLIWFFCSRFGLFVCLFVCVCVLLRIEPLGLYTELCL